MNKIFKTTIIISCISIVSQFFSFIINLLSAKLFGASLEMDAFLVAQLVPSIILTIIIGGFGNVLVPIIVSGQQEDVKDTKFFTYSILNTYIVFIFFITIIGVVFSKELIGIFFPNISIRLMQTSVKISFILWPSAFFSTVVTLFSFIYQAKNKYVFFAITSLINAFIYSFIVYNYNKDNGIFILAYGSLISSSIQLLILFFHLKREFIYNFVTTKELRFFLLLVTPLVLSVFFGQVTKIIDRSFASSLSSGSVSYLSYAEKIKMVFSLLLASGTSITIFPMLIESYRNGGNDELLIKISKSIKIIWIFIVPMLTFGTLFASYIVSMLFERGNFQYHDTRNVSLILPFYLFSLIGGILGNISSSTLYTLKKSKIVAYTDIVSTLLYCIYFPILFNKFGLIGIGFSVAILWTVGFLIHSVYLWHYFNKPIFINFIFNQLFILLIGFCISLIFYLLINKIITNHFIAIFYLIFGIFVYFLTLYFLGNSEVRNMYNFLNTRKKNLFTK